MILPGQLRQVGNEWADYITPMSFTFEHVEGEKVRLLNSVADSSIFGQVYIVLGLATSFCKRQGWADGLHFVLIHSKILVMETEAIRWHELLSEDVFPNIAHDNRQV